MDIKTIMDALADDSLRGQLVSALASKHNLVIRTQSEQDDFLKRFEDEKLAPKVSEAVKKVHDSYDDDLRKVTGESKKDGEKTYDFMKRHFQQSDQQVKDLQKKVADLEKGGADVEKLTADYQESLEAKNKEIADLQGLVSSSKKEAALKGLVGALESKFLPADKLPAMFERTKQAILQDALKNSVLGDDGNLYELDPATNTAKKDSNLKPILLEPKLHEEFKPVMRPDNDPGGLGGQQSKQKPTAKPNVDNYAPKTEITSRAALIRDLKSQGFARGSEDYMAAYDGYLEQNPDLPAMDEPSQ